MAASATREWSGLQEFPAATQQALVSMLRTLQNENMTSLTVLLLGKSGVGKSSTVNSILNERVVVANAFQTETMRPILVGRTSQSFTLNIIDTPGLVEAGCVNDQSIEIIRRHLLDRTIDVMLYVDRLDSYRVDSLDCQVIKAIATAFGSKIWKIGILALTHAQVSPPEGLAYADYVAKRVSLLQEAVRHEVRMKRGDPPVRAVLVENSSRCAKNPDDEKVLPDQTVWLPTLVKAMVDVAVQNRQHAVLVDKKLIDGPNPNRRGKIWIPVILLMQWHLVVKPLINAIKRDVELDEEKRKVEGWEATIEERRKREEKAKKGEDEEESSMENKTDKKKYDDFSDIGGLGSKVDLDSLMPDMDDDDDDEEYED